MEITSPLHEARLYGILDLSYVAEDDALVVAGQMLAGGVHVLQLRAKKSSLPQITALGRALAPLCRAKKVPLIINDHPELVPETGADGAHVGQDDISVAEARRLAGPGAIIGKSTHSLEQALAAVVEAPDYIGFGPLFATPTKPDYQAIGLSEIAEVHRRVLLPIFCIGGIKLENLSVVRTAGAERVVIVSGILQADDRVSYLSKCLTALS